MLRAKPSRDAGIDAGLRWTAVMIDNRNDARSIASPSHRMYSIARRADRNAANHTLVQKRNCQFGEPAAATSIPECGTKPQKLGSISQ
jgi:hypothetical protein